MKKSSSRTNRRMQTTSNPAVRPPQTPLDDSSNEEGTPTRESGRKIQAAKLWLRFFLGSGPKRPGTKNPIPGTVRGEAVAMGFSWSTIIRASRKIGVDKTAGSERRVYFWALPDVSGIIVNSRPSEGYSIMEEIFHENAINQGENDANQGCSTLDSRQPDTQEEAYRRQRVFAKIRRNANRIYAYLIANDWEWRYAGTIASDLDLKETDVVDAINLLIREKDVWVRLGGNGEFFFSRFPPSGRIVPE